VPLDSNDILTMIDEALAGREGDTDPVFLLRRHFLIDLRTVLKRAARLMPVRPSHPLSAIIVPSSGGSFNFQ